MSINAIKLALKEKIEAVTGVGTVNIQRQHTTDWNKITLYFVKDGKVNGWWFEWKTSEGEWGNMTQELIKIHEIKLWGVYALKQGDDSENTFETLVESIMDSITVDRTLNNTVHKVMPVRLLNLDDNMFSNFFCHRAEMLIEVEERKLLS